MLKSVITAACIGVLGGFWIALVDGSIEIFQNYVDGVWRYQIEFNSAAEILVGTVIGVLAGRTFDLRSIRSVPIGLCPARLLDWLSESCLRWRRLHLLRFRHCFRYMKSSTAFC